MASAKRSVRAPRRAEVRSPQLNEGGWNITLKSGGTWSKNVGTWSGWLGSSDRATDLIVIDNASWSDFAAATQLRVGGSAGSTTLGERLVAVVKASTGGWDGSQRWALWASDATTGTYASLPFEAATGSITQTVWKVYQGADEGSLTLVGRIWRQVQTVSGSTQVRVIDQWYLSPSASSDRKSTRLNSSH